jgi:hypothetical protein
MPEKEKNPRKKIPNFTFKDLEVTSDDCIMGDLPPADAIDYLPIKKMGRLISAALYSNEPVNEHYIRACLRGENPYPGDWNDYSKIEEVGIARSRIIDPNGDECLALLRDLEKGITE